MMISNSEENATEAVDMATMPVQLPRDPDSHAAARARFFNSGNAFNVHLPDVPAGSFDVDTLFAETSTSPWRACDQSSALGSPVPATTPLMLARYLRLSSDHHDQPLVIPAEEGRNSGAIWYVISGEGTTEQCGDQFHWGSGDVFMTVGGADITLHTEAPSDALLWCVDNSPMLAHEHVMALPPNTSPGAAAPRRVPLPVPLPVHFPAAEIERQHETLFSTRANDTTSGFALIFSSEAHERSRNLLPTLTLSLNTLPAGEVQRPHRHNSAAITLVLAGAECSTRVDGVRCDWLPSRTLITPPGALHSHHNDDTQGGRARFLIVQDGGLYYLGRTMGFSFADALPARPS